MCRIELSAELCSTLRNCCRREGCTLYMLMLAIFLTALYRYTGQEDLCLGTGVANRRSREAEQLIGMIINTLVLRTDLSGNPTFRALLNRVREVTLGAYENQDLPFEKVVEALQPERNLSYNPFFQVIFGFHDSPIDVLTLPGLELTLTEGLSNGSAKFDINLIVIPRAEQLVGTRQQEQEAGITMLWEYNSDLFELATMQRIISTYQQLIVDLCNNPLQQICHVSLLTATERQQQLVAWNATSTTIAGASVPRMIETYASHAPEKTALEHQERCLTYGELNRRANQLARYLCEMGVGTESLVGICLERSPELIVALLATLKAGAGYLPLDPTYPQERLRFMLADARVNIVLSTSTASEKIAPETLHLIRLDCEQEQIARRSEANLAQEIHAEQVAYVIYTSGSTGTPKGVQIPQRGLSNLVCWHQRAFELTERDRTTQFASLSFDAATWEIWSTLATGATLCLEEIRNIPQEIPAWLAEQEITVSFLPTPLAESVLEKDWSTELKLRLLLTGGDQLHRVRTRALPFTLVNNYGPTESSVVATSGVVPLDETSRMPSIGRPIANTRVYILDQHMQPVPVGVTGELFIGGEGQARGYLDRPDLTAARFCPDPFAQQPGQRLYHTGDLACWRADGTLSFLGRNDTQVKIRGFRIEISEIEAALKLHPLIKETVVLAREDGPGEKRLVAYLVMETAQPASDAEQTLTTRQLRQWLQTTLPDYMLPAAFVLLAQLPLTPNGKLDRQRLPAPELNQVGQEEGYTPPRNPTEELLVGIWADVLGIERVGIYDNFFALGGHSLLATQVLSRIQQVFQVQVPLRTIFEQPHVADFAHTVLQQQEKTAEPALQRIGRRRQERGARYNQSEIHHLSDEEIETLFSRMFSSQEGNN